MDAPSEAIPLREVTEGQAQMRAAALTAAKEAMAALDAAAPSYVEYLGDSPALAAINCTFFDNLALGGRGGRGGTGLQAAHGGDGGNGGSVAGGAVYHADINCMAPDCGSMIHCTVSQNYLLPGRGGDGGIGNINGNQGLDGSGSGGGLFLAPTKYLVGNTIIAGDGCLGAAACSAPDVWGKVISLKYNLIGALDGNSSGWDNAAGAKDRTGMVGNPLDPRLGPLQNNGGETPTLAPLAGSPAIDAGIEDGVPLDKVDQAGQPRRVIVVGISNGGDGSDIGAYELQCSPNVPTLSIARFGNNLILSWPWPSKCFVLQQTSDLTMPNWMDAQYPVNVVGNQNQVVIAQPMGNLFFRFKK